MDKNKYVRRKDLTGVHLKISSIEVRVIEWENPFYYKCITLELYKVVE